MPYPICLAIFAFILIAAPLPAQRGANGPLALPDHLPNGEYQLEPAFQFENALAITSPPGATDQLYFAERAGRIRVVSDLANGTVESPPFLDISDRVTTQSENGLLGLAFHPNYANNGQFFVFYTTNASGGSTNRLSRFERSDSDPLRADPDSERILIDQYDQAANHNGGDLHFGPDGHLYVALGDEGGGNDTYNNSQLIDKDFFAGLLRIDVDKRPDSVEPTGHPAIPVYENGLAAFSVPPDNPLVPIWQEDGADADSPRRLEFYAIGLRNPWRFSFDSETGRLWLGDVGQGQREEINIVEKGGNYGWASREGFISGPKAQTPPPGFATFADPVYDYGRGIGISVTGGVVYRGSRLPELYGAYIFGDYGSGRVFALFRNESGATPDVIEIASYPGHFAYGVDPSNGDVLISGSSGAVFRLVRGDGSEEPDFPTRLSETGAFQRLDTLTPEAGILPYEPNVSFWSDHADKRRWVSIPANTSIGYSEDANWEFPQGSVWIKHFELEMERGNPASRKRVETRFLVKTDNGAYGISYQWNDEETEATLVPAEGSTLTYQVSEDGETLEQAWEIPSRRDCLSCHTEAAGHVLSFNTRQLNRSYDFSDDLTNTLAYLFEIGLLDTPIDETTAEALPRHHPLHDSTATLEARARSYLAVNCASCHQPGASGPATWDARAATSIEATGLLNGHAANDGGDPSRRLVIRGAPDRSILVDRLSGRNGFSRMPPIGSNQLDEEAVKLFEAWISLTPPENASFAEWQAAHFGNASAPEAGATEDPDRDGNHNLLEFLNRTLPLDAQSVWQPYIHGSRDGVTVRFPMAPGRTFVVESSADLIDWAEWTVPGNPPSVDELERTEAELKGELPDSDPALFLRVVVEE